MASQNADKYLDEDSAVQSPAFRDKSLTSKIALGPHDPG
jgi:hypothetical protein